MSKIVQEKVSQAVSILKEMDIDAWLVFVRETSANGDPALPLIYGHDLTWQSALIISKSGECTVILGQLEVEAARQTGSYTKIIPYNQSLKSALLETLEQLSPNKIAINYSKNDVLADGLSLGLYQVLMDFLQGTPWADRLVSSEKFMAALRGRKTQEEIKRIRTAIATTDQIYNRTYEFLKPGLTERQVAEFMQFLMDEYNVQPAWDLAHCPVVNSGPDSKMGHVQPGDIQIERGHLVHFDFGVMQNEYCSDIQRMVYILDLGEKHPPEVVQRGFETMVVSIQDTVAAIKPGMLGKEIDAIARKIITDAGYTEFMHATGHHLGRLAHDGAGILGPEWERYGDTPNYPIEAGHVYTVEPSLVIPGYGILSLEEDILVKDNGAVFMSEPQLEMILR